MKDKKIKTEAKNPNLEKGMKHVNQNQKEEQKGDPFPRNLNQDLLPKEEKRTDQDPEALIRSRSQGKVDPKDQSVLNCIKIPCIKIE